MGLKDLWKDKVNGEDIVDAADINNIAHAVIQLEDEGRVIEETDPTVPNWAKQPNKPSYTASEVGALPADTKIPTKLSELPNDSGYITKAVSDLVNYYKKSEVYSKDEIDKKGFLTEHQDISGKLDASKLPEAINDALAQAKESGEFDGEDGKTAYEYAQDGGYTGTEAEFAEKLTFLMGYSVYGYVDADNNIIIKGNIADGSYIKYEMEDGTTIDIGQLVLDNNVYYSVTSNLTNCTNSNSETQAIGGESYTATITANSGYKLSSVSVTMGGTDISADAVSGGVINIANVAGNIVITAVTEEVTVTPSYTNLLPLSVDIDGSDYVGTHVNGGDGYEYGYRVKKSNGNLEATDGVYCTGFMPVTFNDVIRIKNVAEHSTQSYNNIVFYDASKNYLKGTSCVDGNVAVEFSNGVYTTSPKAFTDTTGTAFFRLSYGSITDDTIVTVNQEIA